MYKTFTSSKKLILSTIAAVAFLMAGSVVAGPDGKVKPGKPDSASILEIALTVNSLNGEFDYLLGAVGCLSDENRAVVVGLLTGRDKYTLFAPTNQAFMDLQAALGVTDPTPGATCAVDTLLGDGTLFTVLAYHLTDGRRFSNSVFNANSAKDIDMLAAGSITTMPNLTIIDGADRTANPELPLVNINASNGVIHVVDKVLLPFNPF
jgi:transforming growth factor-beta-induced protein